MNKGADYRKRVETLARQLKRRNSRERYPLLKKQKALCDMAENEDWLEGKASKSPPDPGL